MWWEQYYSELSGILRVVIAMFLGIAIGIERKIRYKEAGLRTHSIVCAGAALIMVVSKYGFADIPNFDASRIAAQIVSGIGFLGAGIILYKKEALHGLTTAAGIWMTAGIGMAVGAGLYIIAIASTALIIAVQCILHMKNRLFDYKRFYLFRIKFESVEGATTIVKDLFGAKRFTKISFYQTDEIIHISADIKTDRFVQDFEMEKMVRDNAFISSIERIED